jgi:hypothetical protein
VITADLPEHTVDPANPTLNIQAVDSLLVNMKGELEGIEDRKIFSVLDLPRYAKVAGAGGVELKPEAQVGDLATFGRQVAITFRGCRNSDFAAEGIKAPAGSPCGFAVLRDTLQASWVVFSGAQPITFTIRANGDGKGHPAIYQFSFLIRVEDRSWALSYSAGIAVLGVKDHRYRLRPNAEDDQVADLVRVSDGSYPYQLAAFANYMSLKRPWLGLSAGLATEVPSEQLTAMVGVSFALRTLPFSNTAYLTLGGNYTQRARLRAEFEDRATVPLDVTADALVEQRYGFGAFLGLSFGFLGGEEQFTGVFKGKGEE